MDGSIVDSYSCVKRRPSTLSGSEVRAAEASLHVAVEAVAVTYRGPSVHRLPPPAEASGAGAQDSSSSGREEAIR
jgi:hypothetical protein